MQVNGIHAAIGIKYIKELLEKKNRYYSDVIAQKILFFAHMYSLVKYNQQLVKDDYKTQKAGGVFEAWRKGPVAIIPEDTQIDDLDFPADFEKSIEAEIIQKTFSSLWDINEWGLVEMTHSLDCWRNHAQRMISGQETRTREVIPDQEIIQDAKQIEILNLLELA